MSRSRTGLHKTFTRMVDQESAADEAPRPRECHTIERIRQIKRGQKVVYYIGKDLSEEFRNSPLQYQRVIGDILKAVNDATSNGHAVERRSRIERGYGMQLTEYAVWGI